MNEFVESSDHHKSESWSTWDNFNQLHCNSSLSCLVVLQCQFVQNFSSILWSVLHCLYSWWLLRGGTIKERVPDVCCQIKLVETWVTSVLIWQSLVVEFCVLHRFKESFLWHEFQMFLSIRDYRIKLVINNNNFVSILTHLGNMNAHCHHDWVVVWGSDLINTIL